MFSKSKATSLFLVTSSNMEILGEWNLVWARKVVLETDLYVMRIQWQQRMTAVVVTMHRKKQLCHMSYIHSHWCTDQYTSTSVHSNYNCYNLGLFSQVNATFHFLILCTLKKMQHWLYFSKALVLEANPM